MTLKFKKFTFIIFNLLQKVLSKYNSVQTLPNRSL